MGKCFVFSSHSSLGGFSLKWNTRASYQLYLSRSDGGICPDCDRWPHSAAWFCLSLSPAYCHITPSLPPASRFTLSVQVSQTDHWGIIGWCEQNNNRYFHFNISFGVVKNASTTIKTERNMKMYEPTFICPRIFLSTWTSSSSLGVILKTWSLQKKNKKKNQQGSSQCQFTARIKVP